MTRRTMAALLVDVVIFVVDLKANTLAVEYVFERLVASFDSSVDDDVPKPREPLTFRHFLATLAGAADFLPPSQSVVCETVRPYRRHKTAIRV